MRAAEALAALSALASEVRLALVRRLVAAGEEGLAAGAIARELGLSPSRLSFHLAELERAGLVRARRASRNVIYAADHDGIGRVIGYLLNDCCAAHPRVSACCRLHAAHEDTTAGH
ncbi:MAG: helix-turn-helix domain-containing protein [Rhodobacteraceae bacterium]|nr:helix-turn-helix domain-containing protein [Paracoccaceae bacterium]